MTGWRPALRIARRDALRHRARSLAVLVMIGLPVAGVTAADVVFRTQDISAAEAVERDLGAADALVTDNAVPTHRIRLALIQDALGSGARLLRYDTGHVRIRTRIGALSASASEVDLRDPVTRGLLDLERGWLPRRSGEAVVSPALADRGFGPGASLPVLGSPSQRVVGVVAAPYERNGLFVAGLPGAIALEDSGRQYLVDRPGGVRSGAIDAVERLGLAVRSHAVPEHDPYDDGAGPDSSEVGFVALVVIMSLLEVALLAGPAFAVGARARRRTLALLAAAGAGPRDLRRSVLALAVVLGGVGTALGLLAGVGLGRLAVPLVQSASDTRFGPFEIVAPDLAMIGLLGLVSAVLAAAVPAWLAARQDVAAVLAGRPQQPVRRRSHSAAGIVLLSVGVLGAAKGAAAYNGGTIIAVATLFSVAGLVLLVPCVLRVAGRLAARGPLALRFAVRDAARNPSRTTPAVAAVAATVIGVTALGIGSASDSLERERTHTPVGPPGAATISSHRGLSDRTVAAVRRAVPGARVRTVAGLPSRARLQFSGLAAPSAGRYFEALGSAILVARGEIADLGLRLSAEDAQRADATLATGGAVVLGRGEPGLTRTTIRHRHSAPVTVQASFVAPRLFESPAQAVIAPTVAARIGISPRTGALVISGPQMTAARRQALEEVAGAAGPGAQVYIEDLRPDDYGRVARLVLGVVGALLMLGGTLTATFLALADARPDLATLQAVGAAPAARRRIAAAYAASISALGVLLGIVIGFVPGLAAGWSITDVSAYAPPALPDHFIAVPWLLLASIVIGLPMLAAAAVGLLSRSHLPGVSRLP